MNNGVTVEELEDLRKTQKEINPFVLNIFNNLVINNKNYLITIADKMGEIQFSIINGIISFDIITEEYIKLFISNLLETSYISATSIIVSETTNLKIESKMDGGKSWLPIKYKYGAIFKHGAIQPIAAKRLEEIFMIYKTSEEFLDEHKKIINYRYELFNFHLNVNNKSKLH